MRLPRIQYGQVQRAGRVSPGAHLAVGRARANAARIWSSVASDLAADVDNFVFAREKADAAAAAAEYKSGMAKLEATLKNQRVINLNDYKDFIPDKQTAEQVVEVPQPDGTVARLVPGFEVMERLYTTEEKRLKDDLTGNLSRRARSIFEAKTSETTRGSTMRVMTTMFEQRYAAVQSKYDEAFNRSIDNMDEAEAVEVGNEALTEGAWSIEHWFKNMRDMGAKIDERKYINRIRVAEDDADLDVIEEDLLNAPARYSIDTRRQLIGALDKQRKLFEQGQTTVHRETYNKGLQLYGRGRLTDAWITNRLADGTIEEGNARTLFSMNKERAERPVTSNPDVINRLKIDTRSIRYTTDGRMVSENAEAVRAALYVAATGQTLTGEKVPGGPTISGDDYARQMAAVDTAEKAALETPQYRDALSIIGSHTGVKNIFSAIVGNGPNRTAYARFKQDLDRYMDTAGSAARPISWVNDRINLPQYMPVAQEGADNQAFRDSFPEYSEERWQVQRVVEEDGATRTKSFLNVDLIKVDIMDRYRAGEFSKDEAHARILMLTGESVNVDLESTRSIEQQMQMRR